LEDLAFEAISKDGPSAELRVKGKRASKRFGNFMANGKPKPMALLVETLAHLVGGLKVRLEQIQLVCGVDADAAVNHMQFDMNLVFAY
jgi:hypothetical protein